MCNLQRLLTFLLLFTSVHTFAAKPIVLADIIIAEQQALDFPAQVSGFDTTVTILSDDPNAAVFNATGEPNAAVVAKIVENNFAIDNAAGTGVTAKISVDTWTWGGAFDANGVATFDASGNLNNLRIGATAHVSASNIAGDYIDAPTFRLVYQ